MEYPDRSKFYRFHRPEYCEYYFFHSPWHRNRNPLRLSQLWSLSIYELGRRT